MDNVKIHEPLGNSIHNQIHFDINVKSESKNKKTYRRNFHKGNYKDMRKYFAKLDWNNMLMNKTAIECWHNLKYEIESIIDKYRRTIMYKEKQLIVPLYKAIVRPHLEYCIQAWRPYHKKDIDKLEKIQ